MITEPTRKLNTLDLLFCNESIIESIEINETVIFDHNIIHVNSYLKIIDQSDPKVMNPSESVFEQINFFKADWNTIVQEIIASNLSNSIQHLHTEDALSLFVKTNLDHLGHMYQKCPFEEIEKNEYFFLLQASKGSNEEATKTKNVLQQTGCQS